MDVQVPRRAGAREQPSEILFKSTTKHHTVLIYFHEACLKHDPGPGHPEHPGRLRAVVDALKQSLSPVLEWRDAPLATDEQLARCLLYTSDAADE